MYMLKYISILSVLLLSCGYLKHEDMETTHNDPIVCVILFDGTGSFEYIEKSKRTAASLIRELPGGTTIYLRWILAESVSDNPTIMSALIPAEPRQPSNPFATAAQHEYKTKMQKVNAVRDRIINTINELELPNARRTDIMGAIFASTRRFRNNPDTKRVLFILSDMGENVWGNYPNTDLTGIHVRVLDFQIEPGDDGSLEKWWNDWFTDHGAESIEFYLLDDVITYSSLLRSLQ